MNLKYDIVRQQHGSLLYRPLGTGIANLIYALFCQSQQMKMTLKIFSFFFLSFSSYFLSLVPKVVKHVRRNHDKHVYQILTQCIIS